MLNNEFINLGVTLGEIREWENSELTGYSAKRETLNLKLTVQSKVIEYQGYISFFSPLAEIGIYSYSMFCHREINIVFLHH